MKTAPLFDSFLEGLLSKYSIANFKPVLASVCGLKEGKFKEFFASAKHVLDLAINGIWNINKSGEEAMVPPIFGPGLNHVPGGNAYLNRTVFSWHYYCPIINEAQNNNGPMDPSVRNGILIATADLTGNLPRSRSWGEGGGHQGATGGENSGRNRNRWKSIFGHARPSTGGELS